MTWWLWMIAGAVLVLIGLFVWAMCVAAGETDKRSGHK